MRWRCSCSRPVCCPPASRSRRPSATSRSGRCRRAPLTAADVAEVRLPVALRGYRFAETDLLLDRLADELRAARRGAGPAARRAPGRTDMRRSPTAVEPRRAEPDGLDADACRTLPSAGLQPGPVTRCQAELTAALRLGELGAGVPGLPRRRVGRAAARRARRCSSGCRLEAFQSGLSWLIILRKRPGLPRRVRGVRRRHGGRLRRRATSSGCSPTPASSATGPRSRPRSPTPGRSATAVPEGLDALLWSFAPAEHERPAHAGRRAGDIAGVDGDGQGAQAPRVRASSARPPPTRSCRPPAWSTTTSPAGAQPDRRRPSASADRAVAVSAPADQRPMKTGFCLATNAAVALRWSSVCAAARSAARPPWPAPRQGRRRRECERLLDRGVGGGRPGRQAGGELVGGRAAGGRARRPR